MPVKNMIDEIFGCDVFSRKVMRDRLPADVYKKLIKTIEDGTELKPEIADIVAEAMKNWAIEHGATHFTHWFQPLTGVTAEKHDSFISGVDEEGRAILKFSGKELIKGEADASSFPSGGLRATFEARGYTAWDCTSPAFLREDAIGVTLCIPTAFCSYTGDALDKKTPLLKSMQAVNDQALRLIRLFGNTTSKRVTAQVGPEQEYFLIDKEKYLKRKDLIYTGRTLFGANPAKGQELDDHYYGPIRERVGSFMDEVNHELWKLGVTATTQHNEAAPAQHELAPIYAECNLAVDHNQIIMETLKKVANRHGLACLLHEQPFAGVNGSGKHNNRSLSTDDGINLMSPGETPHENIQFLLVLACMLSAVDKHADLLRMSASNVGNEQRLGGYEALPAVISVFVGEQLEDVIEQLTSTGEATHSKQGGTFTTGVKNLPDFDKDATDRNRTSPFAFTGNKFEFRMVGSSDSISSANTTLNTIAAEAFRDAADELEKAEDFNLCVHDMIKRLFREHGRIVFNGNGYSKEWEEEAARRGLPNIKSMVDAIPALVTDKAKKLFGEFGVFTERELESRAEVEYDIYSKAINIEAKSMVNIAGKQIIPAVSDYIGELARNMNEIRKACPLADVTVQTKLIEECSELLTQMYNARQELIKARKEAKSLTDSKERAIAYHEKVVPVMEKLRTPADKLEMRVDKKYWPMPSYGDLMFEV